MNLLTFNIKLCKYIDEVIETIDSVVNGERPDYICLQEYQPNETLEKYLIGMGYKFSTFEYLHKERKNWHQNLLTAYKADIKLTNSYTKILSESKIFGETKGVMICEMMRNGRKEYIVNVHLPIIKRDSKKFIELIEFIDQYCASLHNPVLICGDFNVVRKKSHTILMKLMQKSGFRNVCPNTETFSYLTNSEIRTAMKRVDPILEKIRFKNDWIFANYIALENMNIFSQILHNSLGSDHDPVYIELEEAGTTLKE